MQYIISYLEEKQINSYEIKVSDYKLRYFYINNRFFLIYDLENIKNISNYNNILSALSSSKIQQKFIEKIRFSSKDKETINISNSIKSFLWDLYLIIIYNPQSENHKISDEIKNEIERDKFIARKILIEGQNEEIIQKLNEIIYEEDVLKEIIKQVEPVFSTDEAVVLDAICNNIDDRTLISKELGLDNITKLDDVITYLNKTDQ